MTRSTRNIFAWLCIALFLFYQYALRVMPSVMLDDLMRKFHITSSEFGQFAGFYYLGYTIVHIPVGLLLDYIGIRIVIPLALLTVALSNLTLAHADHWLYACIGRTIIGIASAASAVGLFKATRMYFAEHKFPRILGIGVTIGLLGAIYGSRPIGYLIKHVGITYTVHSLTLCGIILAVISFIIIPKDQDSERPPSVSSSLRELLRHKQWLYISAIGGLMVAPLEGFADGWAVKFLQVAYSLNKDLAATLPSLIFLGLCIGGPILGFIAEKTQAYYTILIVCAVSMTVSFIVILNGIASTEVLAGLFLLIGILSVYQTIVIYKSSIVVTEKLAGLTTACANMIIMIFGYFFHSILGITINKLWNGAMSNGVPIYSAANLTQALTIVPIGLFLAGIGFISIKLITKEK